MCQLKRGHPERPRPSHAETLRRVDEVFGTNISPQVLELLYNDQTVQEAKKKFNGHLVMEMYGVQGRELGQLMATWNSQFSSNLEQAQFVLANPFEKLVQEFEKVTRIQAISPK